MSTDQPDTPKPITVIIADDHQFTRRGIRAELEEFADHITIVAEAKNVAETLECVETWVPDVVLLDLRMPNTPGSVDHWRNGIGAITQIITRVPQTHILVLSMYDEEEMFFQALQVGAHGYIAKSTEYRGRDLDDAIRRVHNGEAIYGPGVAHLIRDYHNQPSLTKSKLTEREQDVLGLLVAAKTNQEIANELTISMGTVKTHVSSILKKMQVKRREQLWRDTSAF